MVPSHEFEFHFLNEDLSDKSICFQHFVALKLQFDGDSYWDNAGYLLFSGARKLVKVQLTSQSESQFYTHNFDTAVESCQIWLFLSKIIHSLCMACAIHLILMSVLAKRCCWYRG